MHISKQEINNPMKPITGFTRIQQNIFDYQLSRLGSVNKVWPSLGPGSVFGLRLKKTRTPTLRYLY